MRPVGKPSQYYNVPPYKISCQSVQWVRTANVGKSGHKGNLNQWDWLKNLRDTSVHHPTKFEGNLSSRLGGDREQDPDIQTNTHPNNQTHIQTSSFYMIDDKTCTTWFMVDCERPLKRLTLNLTVTILFAKENRLHCTRLLSILARMRRVHEYIHRMRDLNVPQGSEICIVSAVESKNLLAFRCMKERKAAADMPDK